MLLAPAPFLTRVDQDEAPVRAGGVQRFPARAARGLSEVEGRAAEALPVEELLGDPLLDVQAPNGALVGRGDQPRARAGPAQAADVLQVGARQQHAVLAQRGLPILVLRPGRVEVPEPDVAALVAGGHDGGAGRGVEL